MKNPDDSQAKISELDTVEELSGSLSSDVTDDKLMHSVLEHDEKTIDDGKIISESLSSGMGSFTPDVLFEKMVNEYRSAKKMYGETILTALTGYDPSYLEKNITIPEFQRHIKKRIQEKIREMRQKKLLDDNYIITDKGVALASLVMYVEEIDNLVSYGLLGEQLHDKPSHYGSKLDIKDYRKHDRYRDLALKRSITTALRRGHKNIVPEDLKTFQRQAKGSNYLIYALDASGSMRGNKLAMSKKAGIALAFKAIDERDNVGLLVFGKEVTAEVTPTQDFGLLLRSITQIRASSETNFKAMIERAVTLFPSVDATKHLIILTDAVPTAGQFPEEETLTAVGLARQAGITVSLIGVTLDENGKKLAEKIVEIGEGRLYVVNQPGELDKIVLMDYYSL